VSNFLFNTAIIFEQLFPALGNPDSRDPLVQLPLRVYAQVPDVLGCLHLDLRVFDGEAKFGWRFVFFLPSGTVVNLQNKVRLLLFYVTFIVTLSEACVRTTTNDFQVTCSF